MIVAGFFLILQVSLIPGTSMTWTDGTRIWAGNQFCSQAGALLQSTSPAVDLGALISGFHCPMPGSALNQPKVFYGGWYEDYCREWYGKSPDAGACEFVPFTKPNAPTNVKIK